MVKADSNLHVYLRILLVSGLIAALSLFPSIRDFNLLLENSHQASEAGDWSSAASYVAKAADLYPWRSELSIQAARLAFQAGDPDTAIKFYDLPAVKNQLTTEDWLALGDAYQQTGDMTNAEAAWKTVTNSTNSAAAFQRLADLYLIEQDIPNALIYLQRLLALNPSDGNLNYKIGLLYAVSEPLKSLPFLAQAAQMDASLKTNALSLHDKIRTASLFDQPAYTLVAAGRELGNLGEWLLAADAFRQATELDPSYSDAWAFLGEADQKAVNSEINASAQTAKAELENALSLDPNSVLANTFIGLYWERQQDYAQAQNYLEQAIAINPDDPYLYAELGNILSRIGDLPAAQAVFETAIKHGSQDPTFYRLLAQFALENNIQTRELALPAARQALMLNQEDPASLDLMAQVMIELQDYHAAEQYCQQALTSDASFSPAYLHLGTVYLYLGEPDLALHWLGLAEKSTTEPWIANQASRMLEYYFPGR
jgi:tetratricopeptide (TPR) repeat protein